MSSTDEAIHLRLITTAQADKMSPDVFAKEIRAAFWIGYEDGKAQSEDCVANKAEYDRDLAKAYEVGWCKGIAEPQVA